CAGAGRIFRTGARRKEAETRGARISGRKSIKFCLNQNRAISNDIIQENIMSDSITLRKLLGLSGAPARLSESALILVDCQNTYREGLMQLAGVEAALEQCA